ncbi:MAG: DUF952 domain-containing protein [Polyangiaceae bacterium]
MRWLYHITPFGKAKRGESFTSPSLSSEGFIHASFAASVAESARLYFGADQPLEVVKIDPRRLDVRWVAEPTPRGPMPHIFGPVVGDAIREIIAWPSAHSSETRVALEDEIELTKIAVIAFEGMTLLDLVGLLDPLSRLRSVGLTAQFDIEVISATSTCDWQAHGASFHVTQTRPDLSRVDVLVIPGGPGARDRIADPSLLAWLASFPPNRLTATVCTGSLFLAALGRLEQRRAATHSSARALLEEHGAKVEHQRVVSDGPYITGGGVTCAIDVGLALVARLTSHETAQKIAAQMEFPWSPAE